MKEPVRKPAVKESVPFRWKYIALPVVILSLSLILTACFYHLLPAEVAHHFTDGSPDRWTGPGTVIAWMLAPQFFFTMLAAVIIWGAIKISAQFKPVEGGWVERLLLLMGNMVALPQIILTFAMLDIFSYNSYQVHLMPLWAFALIVMGLGGIFLGIYFALVVRQVRMASRGNTR